MIGAGRALGWLSVGLVGALFCLRPAAAAAADPPLEAARVRGVAVAAGEATAALDALSMAISRAGDAARTGSALIVAGSDPPGPRLLQAADVLAATSGLVTIAADAVARLRGTLAAVDPGASGPALDLGPAELTSIGSQLRSAVPAAASFVERRQAAQTTLAQLGSALAALTANRPADATGAIERARAARMTVSDWNDPPPELALWLDTTAGMLSAAQRIADALRVGDQAAADAAGTAYAQAAQDAAVADRALELSIAEVGSSITLAPLQRLARADDAVAATQGWVALVGG